ncbi:MAG: hypothetical protein KHY88_01175 [Erysipelotrichaceae bacterium]|nr:hypothetical protein [Erysipelotrichaceae bacterium]
MEWNTIISVMFGTIVAVGAIFFLYQLHNIIVIDAKTRGLKHSRFWGILQLGNNTGEGLIVYLIRRRNCPVINITENDRQEISPKKQQTLDFRLFVWEQLEYSYVKCCYKNR